MNEYKLLKFEVANPGTNKMYTAVLKQRRGDRIVRLNFGDRRYENYTDRTGLKAFPELIHGDNKRRESYKKRHQVFIKEGFYSPGYFSMNYLW